MIYIISQLWVWEVEHNKLIVWQQNENNECIGDGRVRERSKSGTQFMSVCVCVWEIERVAFAQSTTKGHIVIMAKRRETVWTMLMYDVLAHTEWNTQ